jgi:hypothetical protein
MEKVVETMERNLGAPEKVQGEPGPVLEAPGAPGNHRDPFVEPARDRASAARSGDQDVRHLVRQDLFQPAVRVDGGPLWKEDDGRRALGEAGDPGGNSLGERRRLRDEEDTDRRAWLDEADERHDVGHPRVLVREGAPRRRGTSLVLDDENSRLRRERGRQDDEKPNTENEGKRDEPLRTGHHP